MDVKEKDRTSRATNSVYDQIHRSATEMTGDLVQRKTLVAILTASYVGEGGREEGGREGGRVRECERTL